MNVDKTAAILSTSVVTIAVIAGFVLSGPPSEQRLVRLDQSRVADLRRLARAVESYWEDREALPNTLSELVDGRRLSRLPSDPVTGIPYDYEPGESGEYKLCAQFDRPSKAEAEENFWDHPAGRRCYSLQV